MQAVPTPQKTSQEMLAEWRALHPEFSDEDWDFAMAEVKEYLKIAWEIYREQHSDLNLPETL